MTNERINNTRHPELVSGSIVKFALPQRRKTQPYRQINPLRILGVDKVDLPRAMPVFQLLLPRNRGCHVSKQLKMDQPINGVAFRESCKRAIAMLAQAQDQIRRYAYVQRAVVAAGQYIDARLFFLSRRLSIAAKWTLKQVQGDGFLGAAL